ncbi:MAG: transcription-repair coupling factor [Limisphaerales bacterium]
MRRYAAWSEPGTWVSASLFESVTQTPAVQTLQRRLENGRASSYLGVSAGAQPFLAVLVRQLFPQRAMVVVTEGLRTQEHFHQDVQTWLEVAGPAPNDPHCPNPGEAESHSATVNRTSRSLFYPAWELLPHEGKLPHADVISERLEILVALAAGPRGNSAARPLIITSVLALLQRTFPREWLLRRTRRLQRGDRVDPLDLIEWLEDQGYEPEGQVTQRGELALRGGILDVYPLTSPWPVRLEFFGDELESLRYFDPLTQISRETIDAVTLPPGGELGILRRLLDAAPSGKSDLTPSTLLDYLPRDTIFLFCEPEALTEQANAYTRQIPANDPFCIDWDAFCGGLEEAGMRRIEVSDADGDRGVPATPVFDPVLPDDPEAFRVPESSTPSLGLGGLEAFRPLAERAPDPIIAEAQRRQFFAQLHRWLRQGYGVHVFGNNDGECQRFQEIWREYGLDRGSTAPPDQAPACDVSPVVRIGTLTRGFICDAAKQVVITDAEIFGRYKIQRPRRLKPAHAQVMRSALDIDFTELEEGDYVVHLQYGIGRYLGLKALPATSGRKGTDSPAAPANAGQECLVIEYASADPEQPPPKLYVPVTEAHLVSKYVGAGKARPPLNALGGTRWAKARAQAERAVRDLAAELLALQAARATQPGHAFAVDSPWQREFESSFIYEETPDQFRAIAQTKTDMEAPRPMDRLICGDVGFGKTEVAIRAAFKAVMDGKQVAVLVPTTILAQQHFNTFRERMADYPARIELLSRFRSRREQKRVVDDLAAGAVDIVIGTHRLLQSDIAIKDLGLIVIDEEQRFGVLHKERLKQLRQLVDVLTLSATPIPRTLYLALTGARDMSTIETPPQDRLPVETLVMPYDERVIRNAIQRELSRQGQVFFLHNRVDTIETMAHRLRSLTPQARIVVGHGQMQSDQLEEVMSRFVNGDADVLLSTTIIESGLDIPNANTIIIDRADRFGLSDLYQLRGRVGRYKNQAYAYFLLPRHTGLLSDAQKRISAIKQYSSLGSGFKIAMRDLEIRGAGNLLGPEQSGHITAVGFELYCQLLKQSVGALKGEKVKRRIEVQVRLDFLDRAPVEEVPGAAGQSAAGAAGARVPPNPLEPATESPLTDPREPELISPRAADFSSREGGASQVPPRLSGSGPQPARSNANLSKAAAYIPMRYISEARQRVEIYRKLAQAAEVTALKQLRAELRDRFGPLPDAVDLLLRVTELKVLAGDRGITAIETKIDRLMLTRHDDFITFAGKFPRLKKSGVTARLNEIKKLLMAL